MTFSIYTSVSNAVLLEYENEQCIQSFEREYADFKESPAARRLLKAISEHFSYLLPSGLDTENQKPADGSGLYI